MSVPLSSHDEPWAQLEPEAKRERLLAAARELFAREGLAASMPAVAAAAGAGVGSVYRQFADKDDLVAALVVQRVGEVREVLAALPSTDDPGADVEAMIWAVIDGKDGCDDIVAQAIALNGEREDVVRERAVLADALEAVLAPAREAGAIRADVGVADLRLLFTAVRAADAHASGGGRRLAELLVAGLRAT